MAKWLVLLTVLITAVPIHAQSDVIPLQVGENLAGAISQENPTPSYRFSVEEAGSFVVQVLALTSATPEIRVLDSSGAVIVTAVPTDDDNAVSANAALSAAGAYTIEVIGAAGTQFVITVEEGMIVPPPTPLIVGERLAGSVDPFAPAKAYSLNSDSRRVLVLSAYADRSRSAPSVAVRDGSGVLIAFLSGSVQGGSLRVPRGNGAFTLTITYSGSGGAESYSLCLETEDPTIRCEPYQPVAEPEVTAETTAEPGALPTATPLPAFVGNCRVSSAVGVFVNIRRTPSLSAEIVGQLPAEGEAAVIGRSPDGIWWQIISGGTSGWVSSAVTQSSGMCDSLPVVSS